MEQPSQTNATVTNTRFYCHNCENFVQINKSSESSFEPHCPLESCQSEFVEEIEDNAIDDGSPGGGGGAPRAGPTSNPVPEWVSGNDMLTGLLQQINAMLFPGLNANTFTSTTTTTPAAQAGNPFANFAQLFQPFPPSNVEEFAAAFIPQGFAGGMMGGRLDDIITQIMENSQGPMGTPPAKKDAVKNLPRVKVSDREPGTQLDCAVCKDELSNEDSAVEMPCSHLFHENCILPWLESHNSCPVCRHELPTDDPDYEARRSRGQNQYSRPR
mmetsp:Transcript_29770/g.48082  ORF Transcript_29770/g.48082 Transcript_29770/m.48082 type:complete len:271 (-) Transcript_29770:421-1233(-)